ncbi:hypothetical protein MD484_g843, partial [Candolleomyces efflorescens]
MSLQQALPPPVNLKPGYPASELIKALIERYYRDFARYRRNVCISQMILQGWHSIYDGILSHMDNVATTSKEPQWDSFTKHTLAITQFEGYLLNLDFHLSVNGVPSLPVNDEISVIITFMTNWVNNRRNFIDAGKELDKSYYKDLFKDPRPFQLQAEQAVRQDDIQALKDLNDSIASHELQDCDITGSQATDKFVSNVKATVRSIRSKANKLSNEKHDRMGRIVFALMAIYIPFVCHQPNTPTAHINSRNVWSAADTFAVQTEQFASPNSNLTLEKHEENWAIYRHVLMTQFGSEYIIQIDTLMNLAAQVRWQYIGRTLSVVLLNEDINRLLDDTVSEFKKAATEVNFFADPRSLDAALAARDIGYSSVVRRMEAEIKKHPSGAQKWDNLYSGYQKGAEDDAEHVRQFRQFVASSSPFITLKAAL